ncbi:MAG: hypothetical protein ABW044_11225 [Cellvibrio sp.]
MNFKKFLLLLIIFPIGSATYADVVGIDAVPKDWKLENYIGGTVALWYTGSSCSNGSLQLPASATKEDKDRLWSLILAAKLANKKVSIRYDNTACTLVSYGLYLD